MYLGVHIRTRRTFEVRRNDERRESAESRAQLVSRKPSTASCLKTSAGRPPKAERSELSKMSAASQLKVERSELPKGRAQRAARRRAQRDRRSDGRSEPPTTRAVQVQRVSRKRLAGVPGAANEPSLEGETGAQDAPQP